MRVSLFNIVRRGTVAALLALTAGCQTTPPVTAAWKLPDGVKTVGANGYPISYVEKGSGPTVLLVHGSMCDYRCLSTLSQQLPDRYHIVSVSLRHHYPEPWDGSGNTYSVPQHARDLAAVARQMSPPVRIVAHSYGGAVAFEMAREHPELVSKLVLAEASTDGLMPPPTAENLAARQKFVDATANLIKAKGPQDAMPVSVDMLFGKGTFASYPAPVQAVHFDNAWTLVGSAKAPAPTLGTCSDFGSLKMPVLLATGAKTPPRYKQLIAAQQKCLPSAKTLVVPDVAHGPIIGHPTFIAAVEDFLR
jgi:esterase